MTKLTVTGKTGKVVRATLKVAEVPLSEVWISAFGFTLQPMFDDLKKADASGARIHLLLDHSQSVGYVAAQRYTRSKDKEHFALISVGDVVKKIPVPAGGEVARA